MSAALQLEVFLSDADALIELAEPRGPIRVRQLTRLVDAGYLRVPAAVARELRERDDRLGNWVKHGGGRRAIVQPDDRNIAELSRVSREHADLIGTRPRAADPVLVAMGKYYSDRYRWSVLSNDGGVQAACHREGIRVLPVNGFRRLFGF